MPDRLSGRDCGSILVCLASLVPYALLVSSLHAGTRAAILLYLLVLVAYLGVSYYVVEHWFGYRHLVSPTMLGGLLVCCTVAGVLLGWIPLSPIAVVHLGAIVLMFGYWLLTAAALYHQVTSHGRVEGEIEYPSITVLVPAYNEEGYVGRTIASLLAASYPPGRKRIVVVDDGSTDGTYDEASQFGSDTVTVVRKEKGGKYSALNYGLLFADTEVIVTVDADSIVETTALLDVVAPLEADPDVGAVASCVKLFNRDSLVTRCQTLEYVFGINIYHRVFDLLASVSVVPGCLGAYRRTVLEDVNAYDPDTLTEDFDITMKVLREGYRVRFSEAVVYTEAPDTWRDLYNQRLRWYRGNIMTLKKHLRGDPGRDHLYFRRILLPFVVVTMVFLPLASGVILGVIAFIALTSGIGELLFLFLLFMSIVVLANWLAVRIGRESPWYVLYAPLFVIGYKHFHDAIMVKSMADVLRGTEMDWTNASRIDQRGPASSDLASESASDRSD